MALEAGSPAAQAQFCVMVTYQVCNTMVDGSQEGGHTGEGNPSGNKELVLTFTIPYLSVPPTEDQDKLWGHPSDTSKQP